MKKIFISYSSFEEDFGGKLKGLLKNIFHCEIFAFNISLKLGDEWFGIIRKNLKEADLHIIILSPISVTKPWTYFEAGGSWIKGDHSKNNEPIPMRLCLSKDRISASNPLSKLWIGDFFKKEDIEKLFEQIKRKIYLPSTIQGGQKELKDKFVEGVTSSLGDEYKILDAFRKIMEKDVSKEPNIHSLHKRGMAPVLVILYEAFGENCMKEKLDIDVNDSNKNNHDISIHSPAKLGEIIRHFESLSNQGIIERIDTPLEKFLKKTIRKIEKDNFPSEVPEALLHLLKENKMLDKTDFKIVPQLKGLMEHPVIDEGELITFFQTTIIIKNILSKGANMHIGFSPARIWWWNTTYTEKWWDEYKDYFSITNQSKIRLNLYDGGHAGIMGSFHDRLWKINYEWRELREFLRSWYKLSI